MSGSTVNATKILQKTQLRKLMKGILKNISIESKKHQSSIVTGHLLNQHKKFKDAKHIALYLAMKQEEIDTVPMIEEMLTNSEQYGNKHIYVPHIDMNKQSTNVPEMCFFQLNNLEQYNSEMNCNNRFNLRQFTSPDNMIKADPSLFDLVIVPGLCFDKEEGLGINRLGRGKGYYDAFLSKIPSCDTLAIGFNEQFIPKNKQIQEEKLKVPMDSSKDVVINEFLCAEMIC